MSRYPATEAIVGLGIKIAAGIALGKLLVLTVLIAVFLGPEHPGAMTVFFVIVSGFFALLAIGAIVSVTGTRDFPVITGFGGIRDFFTKIFWYVVFVPIGLIGLVISAFDLEERR